MDDESPDHGDVDPAAPHFFRTPDGGYIRPVFTYEGLKRVATNVPVLGNGTGRSYCLAMMLLQDCFGIKWVERHILDEPEDGFLGRHLGKSEGTHVVMHRVRSLAELVVNLMAVHGVASSLDQIAGGAIKSGYAELEVGKLLLSYGVPFRFIRPSGVKGESFDLEVVFPNGRPVCADTKCKLETKEFSANGLLSTLNEARKRNLPKGFPGAIFVKIPRAWHADEEIMGKIGETCRRFLRGTKRIVAVEVYSSMVNFRSNVLHDWPTFFMIG